jgi:hypothetical protein
MTITFPRDLPFDGLLTGDCSFDLVRNQARSLTGSGSPDVVEVAPPYWVGKWSTRVLTREDLGVWEAWLSSLRGGLRLFKGRPNRHKYPYSRPGGFGGLTYSGDPFSGIGNLSNIAAGRDVVTINEIANGIVLAPGDWFSINVGSRQHIHRITEGATSATNAVTVSCEPIIMPGVVATDIDVRLDTPFCDMTLAEQPQITRDPVKGGSISFTGQQILI